MNISRLTRATAIKYTASAIISVCFCGSHRQSAVMTTHTAVAVIAVASLTAMPRAKSRPLGINLAQAYRPIIRALINNTDSHSLRSQKRLMLRYLVDLPPSISIIMLDGSLNLKY